MESTFEQTRRDAVRPLSGPEFAAALRQLADCLEQGKPFEIEIDGEKVLPPADATLSIEHERSEDEEELEFQLKWSALTRADRDEKREGEEHGDAVS